MNIQQICPVSGECILFGRGENIFDAWFQDIRKAGITSIRSIGVPSNNGFIRELKRTEKEYDSYVVLKSNLTSNSDNLYYEWYVGSYLNTLMKRFPIFVKTYGIYEYEVDDKEKMLNDASNATDVLRNLKNTTMLRSLQQPELQCIVVQHVHQSISFTSLLEEYAAGPTDVLKHEILCILYQIYFVLPLIPSFSHNDLHTDNVILTPAVDKCYQYVYGTFSFQCRYAAKLIDYGRCVCPGTSWFIKTLQEIQNKRYAELEKLKESLTPQEVEELQKLEKLKERESSQLNRLQQLQLKELTPQEVVELQELQDYPEIGRNAGYPFTQVGIKPCPMVDLRLLKRCMDYRVIDLSFFEGMQTIPILDVSCENLSNAYLKPKLNKKLKGFPGIRVLTGKLETMITPMYSLPIACTIYISDTEDMRVVWPPVGGQTRHTRQTRQRQTKRRRKSYRRRVPPLR